MDCQRDNSDGCDGGVEFLAIDYVTDNGLVIEDQYPYRGLQQECLISSGPYKISNYIKVEGRLAMQRAIRRGPITAAVHVNQYFRNYKQGIFDLC